MSASTLPAPMLPCCNAYPAAAFLDAKPWPEMGILLARCPGCGSHRAIAEMACHDDDEATS